MQGKNYFTFLVVVLFIAGFGITVYAGENFTGNVNLVLGSKSLDEDDWDPVNEQTAFGLEFNCKHPDWPISLAIGWIASYNQYTEEVFGLEAKIEGATVEKNIGVLKIWDKAPYVRPFVGGGLCFLDAAVSGTLTLAPGMQMSISDEATGTGMWFTGGVYWTLWEHLNLGVNLKISSVSVAMVVEKDGILQETNVSAGGNHFGGFIGFHW